MTGSEAKVRKLQGEKREFPETEAKPPRPLVWLGKRLLTLAIASGAAGYAFHLFGTWPLGVVAIATPIGGWVALILSLLRTFRGRVAGINPPGTRFPELFPPGHSMAKAQEDLAAQMDWKRRFGT